MCAAAAFFQILLILASRARASLSSKDVGSGVLQGVGFKAPALPKKPG